MLILIDWLLNQLISRVRLAISIEFADCDDGDANAKHRQLKNV